jgi:UTP--glucose-1-phosphate uridylyltransferase
MNSFATDEASRQHIEENDYFGCPSSSIHPFLQNISIRLTPDGDLFRRDDGTVSLYSPGHGDMPEALNRGPLEDFLERGGEYLMMSNVDNLLATLDPLVIGSHIKASSVSDVEMTVEAVEATPDDAGGKPARVDGSLEIVESFRFPEEFDWEDIPVFNTNTFMFDAEALQQDFDLGWYLVEKTVQGRTAIQFERLAGELSHFLKTKVLRVPREGDQARFQPIKTRDDLANNRERIKRILQKRGFESELG